VSRGRINTILVQTLKLNFPTSFELFHFFYLLDHRVSHRASNVDHIKHSNIIYQYKTMKFSTAAIIAVVASSCSVNGFVPTTKTATATSRKVGVLSMSTETPTKTYTFTKSEEIFAEAQTVRQRKWLLDH
jgi:hypothetical protein